MTGFINPGANPLSLVSVRALRDLGYTVSDIRCRRDERARDDAELGLSFGRVLRNVLASPLAREAFRSVRRRDGDGRLRTRTRDALTFAVALTASSIRRRSANAHRQRRATTIVERRRTRSTAAAPTVRTPR
jgi:hypothetical protein